MCASEYVDSLVVAAIFIPRLFFITLILLFSKKYPSSYVGLGVTDVAADFHAVTYTHHISIVSYIWTSSSHSVILYTFVYTHLAVYNLLL